MRGKVFKNKLTSQIPDLRFAGMHVFEVAVFVLLIPVITKYFMALSAGWVTNAKKFIPKIELGLFFPFSASSTLLHIKLHRLKQKSLMQKTGIKLFNL